MREQAVEAALNDALLPRLTATLNTLADAARAEVATQNVAADQIAVTRRAHIKYDGTDTALTVAFGSVAEMTQAFEAAYLGRYSFLMPGRALVVEAVAVEAASRESTQVPPSPRKQGEGVSLASTPRAETQVPMFSEGAYNPTPLYRAENLKPGNIITGSAIITDANATTVVEPEWQAEVTALGHLLLTRCKPRAARTASTVSGGSCGSEPQAGGRWLNGGPSAPRRTCPSRSSA